MRFTIYDLRFTSQRASVHNHLVSAFRFPLSAFARASLVVLIFLLGGGMGHTQTNSYGVRVGTSGVLVSPGNFFQTNGVLTNNQVGVTLNGVFSGNGAGLTNVPGAGGGGGNTYALGNSNATVGQTFVLNGTNFFVGTNTTGFVSAAQVASQIANSNLVTQAQVTSISNGLAGQVANATNGITGAARLNPSSIITNNYANEFDLIGNTPSYYQLFVQNLSPYGSSSIVFGNDLATPTSTNNYGEVGINGSQYIGVWGKTNDTYFHGLNGDIWMGPDSPGSKLHISVGTYGAFDIGWFDSTGWIGNSSTATLATNAAPGGNILTTNGNGSALTGLTAGQSGSQTTNNQLTLLAAIGAAAVVTNNATGVTLTGAFTGNGSGLTNLAPTIVTATNFTYAPGGGSNAVAMTVLAFTNGTGQVTYSVQDDDRSQLVTNDDRVLSLTNTANTFSAATITASNHIGGGFGLTNNLGSGYAGLTNNQAVIQTNFFNVYSGSNCTFGRFILNTNYGLPTLAQVGGTNIPFATATNATSGGIALWYYNVSSVLTAAPLNVGTFVASSATIGQMGNFAETGNITGNTATTGTAALTNIWGTNIFAQRAFYIGATNGLAGGMGLTYTNGIQASNTCLIYGGSNSLTGPTLYVGSFNVSSNLVPLNLGGVGQLNSTNIVTSTEFAGKSTITNLAVGTVVLGYTNLAIFDGSKGVQFLYTNTTNPVILFTNFNVGVQYSLDIIQTNSGASGGPWFFTNFQGGFSNSFVCWPNGVVQTPATNFGARSHYTFTGLPFGTTGTNIIITGAITNY